MFTNTVSKIIATPVWVLFLFFPFALQAQNISGKVTGEGEMPLAFATIKFGDTKQGLVTDLNGNFSFPYQSSISYIEVSYLNYESKRVPVSANTDKLDITLQSAPATLETVVVKTTSNKLRRILLAANRNRDKHNPDKYDYYRCNIYYKMVADADFKSPGFTIDTSKEGEAFQKMMEQQHVLVTETFSTRTWQKPARLQEEVKATRMSGFEKSLVAGLVTDVLPFHAYNDFIKLNEKEFHNPISGGLFQRHQFSLQDELLQGSDTVWVIQFSAKRMEELSGTLFIHSDGYSISRIIAQNNDTLLKRYMGIEQQYIKSEGRWFPEKLNYTYSMNAPFGIEMRGTSFIDSISWNRAPNYKFDKAHTVQLLANADRLPDSQWINIRPMVLPEKELRTYHVMDSLGKKANVSRFIDYVQKAVEGKFPVGKFDILLPRIFSYNNYENSRVGLGLQTNEKISSKFSVGAWGGYGTGDKAWKYGAFAEVYGDRFKESVLQLSYYNDLRDPGRLQIHPDLDKNLLRMFLLSRVDRVEGWNVSMKKKFGYLSLGINATAEKIIPQYNYQFEMKGKDFQSFSTREAGVDFRYAYGERTSPMLGKYYPTGSKFPILYGKINVGKEYNTGISYTQAVAAISWQKRINRFGTERFLIEAGQTFSDQQVPFTKLFAGNGFVVERRALYAFGGMLTMRPYDFYADRFVSFNWLHTFHGQLYKWQISKKGLTSAPNVSIGYNGLIGDMKNASAHKQVAFQVPTKGYHEVGLLLNNILRVNVMGMGYMGLQAGYFYNLSNNIPDARKGRFVYGLTFSL